MENLASRGSSADKVVGANGHQWSVWFTEYHTNLGSFMRQDGFRRAIGGCVNRYGRFLLTLAVLCGGLLLTGCPTPMVYREKADRVADKIIAQKQKEALGHTEPLEIVRPSDLLRRRLLIDQNLPYSSDASLGTDALPPIPHWPKDDYPPELRSPDANIPIPPDKPLRLSLVEALEVGALNSAEYQSGKEDIFRAALSLDLQRYAFTNIFSAGTDSQATTDTLGDETLTSVDNSASASVSRTFKNGMDLSALLAVDLLNLLTQGGTSVLGLNADASVSIPLLRGSGAWIVAEPLTQAEREVVYRIWEFEQFRQTFAVNVAQSYFNVLRQMDSLKNNENNYRSAVQSARWSRRQADAGRLAVVDVDQAVQRELSSRNGWIAAQEQLKSSLDSFKSTIGLPVDAVIEVDPNELDQLSERADKYIQAVMAEETGPAEKAPPADAPVELIPASREDAGPYEMDETVAIKLALRNRLDLRVANGGVYDAQRQVVVAADALGAGLNLGGSARFVGADDRGGLSFEGARYSALLSLDLPIERTRERDAYRSSLINLERSTRNVQTLENTIKEQVRTELRTLLQSREDLKIQAQSVVLARRQVKMVTLFLEAGRRQIRDLLDAQDARLSAENGLTSAVIRYRTAELQLQRDLGVLMITNKGLWREYSPGETRDDI
jgi:outer membrane protein TolC